MVLGGTGDAMGYNCGNWEFNENGFDIHRQVCVCVITAVLSPRAYSKHVEWYTCQICTLLLQSPKQHVGPGTALLPFRPVL